jgi:glycosyltransferase involved in cell wall biosynthesis
MLKICFLSLLHRYDDTRIFYKEARTLAKAGFDVTHLASGKVASHIQDGVRIEIYHTSEKKGIKGRIGKMLPLYKRAVKMNADCYHCNEIESWPIGWMIKVFYPHKRIIFDVHEYYPSRFDNPIFPNWLNIIANPFTKMIYRLLSPKTDHIIFVNPAFAKDFPGTENKQSIIYNYGLLEMNKRSLQDVPNSIKQEFPNHATAIHIGGFGKSRGWPQLLQALSLMRRKDFSVLCLGDLGGDEDKILTDAKRLGVADQIFVKQRVPYEEMFDHLLCANAGLILFQPGIQNHVLSFPQKLHDYLLAGLPVIAPNFAVAIDKLIQEEKCGISINTGDPEEIAQALDWLCENLNLAVEMGKRGRRAIYEKYNWDLEASKLINIYSNFEKNIR